MDGKNEARFHEKEKTKKEIKKEINNI